MGPGKATWNGEASRIRPRRARMLSGPGPDRPSCRLRFPRRPFSLGDVHHGEQYRTHREEGDHGKADEREQPGGFGRGHDFTPRPAPGPERIYVDGHGGRAVLQIVLLLMCPIGKLTFLANGDESGLELHCGGGGKNEATCVNSDNRIHRARLTLNRVLAAEEQP